MEKVFREVKTKLYLRKDENVNFPAHIHEDIELVYVLHGGGSVFCDGKQYTLCDGSVFLAFPEQVHSFHDCVDGAYILLIIKPSRLLYVEEIFRTQLPVSAVCTGTPTLERLLSSALEEHTNKADSLVVNGYLTAFFGKLFQRMPLQQNAVSNETVSRILQYCSQHFKEAVCQQALCDSLNISRSYVSRIFSDQLKISFPEYMNALRLNKAISLLQESGLNMTQVAERAGFPTIRTFNRVFRKQFGCSPLEYRKRQKERT